MSLISQTDRQMAIEALEFYIYHLHKDNCNQAEINAFTTLLRWIELEHFKNDNGHPYLQATMRPRPTREVGGQAV